MNCEAGSSYPHRARLEEAQVKTCFSDYQDLMVAARIGKEGYIKQIAGYCTDENDTRVSQVSWAIFEVSWGKTKHRDTDEIEDLTRSSMKMTRVCVYVCVCVCVYHVGQKYASDSPGIVGECLAVLAFECARYQVDVIAGDGNKLKQGMLFHHTKDTRGSHIRTQPHRVLDQQNHECCNTSSTQTF